MDSDSIFMLELILAGLALGAAWIYISDRISRYRGARDQRRIKQHLGQIEAKGWRLEPIPESTIRYQIHGTSDAGIAWILHYDSDAGSTNAYPMVVWRAVDLKAPRTEFWSSSAENVRRMTVGMGGMATKIAGLVAASLRGASEAGDMLSEGKLHVPRDAALRETFVVVCQDPARCARIFNDEVERRVLAFPTESHPPIGAKNMPATRFDANGLEVSIGNRDGEMAAIQYVVAIGEAIAAGIRDRSTF
jgi:hypothetical protein